MYLSASQIKMVYPVYDGDDGSSCAKNWYNKYIKKLPIKEQTFTNLGSRLHACIETYLESPDNVEVSPFFDGWKEGLDSAQQETVKVLVEKGINDRHVVKHTQRFIELPMYDGGDIEERREIFKVLKPTWKGDFLEKSLASTWEIIPGVFLTGFIDLYHSGNKIVDWKTSSDPDRYGLLMDKKSYRYVARDLQLNIYACYLRKVKGVKGPINVGHTYFKTKPDHKIMEKYLDLSEDHIDKFYKWLTTTAIPYFQKLSKMTEGVINTLPVGKKACEKYRGCAYQKMCSGALTEAEYIRAHNIRKEISKMGLMDNIKKKQAEVKKEEPEAKVEKVVKEGLGVVGGLDPREAIVEEIKALGGKPPRKDSKIETFQKKLNELKAEKATEEEEKVEPPTVHEIEEPEVATPTVPISFGLVIGASIRSTNNNFTTLVQFFNEVTSGMCHEMGEKDWWSMDPFKRRELFHGVKDQILRHAHGKTIVARFIEPDTQALLNVLYDHATTIIEGGMR